MRKTLLLFVLIFTSIASFAAHIIGGEMRYIYVGPGSTPNTKVYRITMILFRGDNASGAPLAPSYVVAIYNNDTGLKFPGSAGSTGNNWQVTMDSPPDIQSVPIILPSCIQGAPVLAYTYASYSMTVTLPNNSSGYTVAYQTCCRINGMINVGNSTGSTYMCTIPGSSQLGPTGTDTSPQFGVAVNVICKNAPFTLNFSATDPNPGDSLVYGLCNAYNGGASSDASFDNPAPPPYGSVFYTPPYSGGDPFGTGASIDPRTGIITGMAPDEGNYVVSVCITVYRSGVIIGSHRKDLIVRVSDCVITVANPMPDFVTCDGFNVQFSHTSTGANTVFWNFGDNSTLADTSLLANPSYTFPDTGIYVIKLIINRGTSCVDSAVRSIGVYPGFFPGFTQGGSCFTNPFQFTDTTKTNYGTVSSWSWNFGDLTTLADTSHLQNPQWTYPGPGPVNVRFIVTNSKGCRDTIFKTVNILDKPLLLMDFKDTLICRNDAVQLGATGAGTFTWTPPVNIVGANTANPTVSPTTTTWYYVLMNDNGCLNNDSVQVRVVPAVTLFVSADTTICLSDQVQLHAVSDGLSFTWTPSGDLDDPTIKDPVATPTGTTIYSVTATIGSCTATDQIEVTTVPYPVANAGPDPLICYNTSVQLNASITGAFFTWTPTTYLNDPLILNPVSSPPRTTQYILTVTDTLGCPKPVRDTITVNVNPKLVPFAGNDTTVVVNQPLQFNATGGVSYVWSPGTGLSSTTIHNPIGMYGLNIDSVVYKVIVTDAAGCSDSASVTVRVFKTNPSVFVPTAFTPNGDGRNDVIRPIAVGMQRISFSIYNRWGQPVFTTTKNGQGWDGRINGKLQDSGVFVWMASGLDYLGQNFFQKGTVTLIR